MTLSDFRIGAEFTSEGRTYRCTDVGSRVIAAIRIDASEQGWADRSTGESGVRSLSRSEAEAIDWFNGPPYGVVEHLFDEDDQELCEPA